MPIDDYPTALREDIEPLISKPYLAPLQLICGFVYNIESGHIDDASGGNDPRSERHISRMPACTLSSEDGGSSD